MMKLKKLALASAGLVGLAGTAWADEEAKGEPGVVPVHTLKISVPEKQPDGSTVEEWGLAAPVVDGISDPNLIVYDQALVERYAEWAVNTPTECGPSQFTVVAGDSEVTVTDGLEHAYLGKKFKAEEKLVHAGQHIEHPSAVAQELPCPSASA